MHTTFNDIKFKGCKLVGVPFQSFDDLLLTFSFKNCTLNLSAFYQLKINKTKFSKCKMYHVDYTETDAQNTTFSNYDLKDSIFDSTSLENADFSTAHNFSINPSTNPMKNAIFSKENCFGLLSSFKIKIK